MTTTEGASSNERLLAAARTDNEEMLMEVFEKNDFDINFQDGLGNTALHYAVSRCSTDILEHILSHEECDVDPVNRLEKATPLHLAVIIEDPDVRKYSVESLLDAGADMNIKNKNGNTALDLVDGKDTVIQGLFRRAKAIAAISRDDIANDSDSDEGGSGSGSDED